MCGVELCLIIVRPFRTADEATAVNFDPDSFIDAIQHMLGQTVAKQPHHGSDSEDTQSNGQDDDALSISSEESETSEPGECASGGVLVWVC